MIFEAPNNQLSSLYVGNLHLDITDAILFDVFSSTGFVHSVHVSRDAVTGLSRSYANVNFYQLADAERAVDELNMFLIKGQPIYVMPINCVPSSLHKCGADKIFVVMNVDKRIDTNGLYDTLSNFGKILSCKIAQDENGASKGYAFLHFETEEAAKKVIAKVSGMLLNGKKIYFAKTVPDRDREKPQILTRAKHYFSIQPNQVLPSAPNESSELLNKDNKDTKAESNVQLPPIKFAKSSLEPKVYIRNLNNPLKKFEMESNCCMNVF